MEKEKCCGTCKWHEILFGNISNDWMCSNEESEFYCDFTSFEHVCDEWEEK